MYASRQMSRHSARVARYSCCRYSNRQQPKRWTSSSERSEQQYPSSPASKQPRVQQYQLGPVVACFGAHPAVPRSEKHRNETLRDLWFNVEARGIDRDPQRDIGNAFVLFRIAAGKLHELLGVIFQFRRLRP